MSTNSTCILIRAELNNDDSYNIIVVKIVDAIYAISTVNQFCQYIDCCILLIIIM